ncbi:RNA-binding (RRM/RBD/RNP motifs) family protein [Tasmannia lanceolata]|uniref:RNA-binding (RRM/RBD/RNP motifs) family protein n=1 Tax=Tasmannia lanceolata TaxID=3420 RepID=UPI004063CE2D
MPGNPGCTVYVGNLDEKVNDRILYEILVQAGRIVDLYIPRDKETNRPKGFAFAEYETEEIANYAVKLFSGLVSLYNRTLKFAISGQDKPSQNLSTPTTPLSNSPPKPRSQPVPLNNTVNFQQPLTPCRFSAYTQSDSPNYPQAYTPPGVVNNGYRSDFNANNFDYSRRVFGATLGSISRFEAHSSRATYDSRT